MNWRRHVRENMVESNQIPTLTHLSAMTTFPSQITKGAPFEMEWHEGTKATLTRYRMAMDAGAVTAAESVLAAEFERMSRKGIFWTPLTDYLATELTSDRVRSALEYRLRLAKQWVRKYGHPTWLATLARSFRSPAFRAMLAQNAPVFDRDFIESIYDGWNPDDAFLERHELWRNRHVRPESRVILREWAIEQITTPKKTWAQSAIEAAHDAKAVIGKGVRALADLPLLPNLVRRRDDDRCMRLLDAHRDSLERDQKMFDRMTLAANVLMDAARQGELTPAEWRRIETFAAGPARTDWERIALRLVERIRHAVVEPRTRVLGRR